MSDKTRPREAKAAYPRWKMASFDPPPTASSPNPGEQAAFAAEVQRLRDAAHAEGLASGHVAGQALGYQAGYDQGHKQGFEQGLAAAHAQAAQLATLAGHCAEALTAAQDGIADSLVDLALDIAQQVVRQQVQHDPTVLVAAAREVRAAEPALTGSPQLVVSPADLPVVEAYLQDELRSRGWSVRTDASIERGGCRAQAASGEVDARIGTRWERVAAALGRNRPW